jgi:hypothetical protein
MALKTAEQQCHCHCRQNLTSHLCNSLRQWTVTRTTAWESYSGPKLSLDLNSLINRSRNSWSPWLWQHTFGDTRQQTSFYTEICCMNLVLKPCAEVGSVGQFLRMLSLTEVTFGSHNQVTNKLIRWKKSVLKSLHLFGFPRNSIILLTTEDS